MSELKVLTDAEAGQIVALGLDDAALAAMPQGSMSKAAIDCDVRDAVEYEEEVSEGRRAEIVAEISAPAPTLRLVWGSVRLSFIAADDDICECLKLEIFLDAGEAQPDDIGAYADMVPEELEARIKRREVKGFDVECDDGDSSFASGGMRFWPKGMTGELDREAVATFLSTFFSSGRFSEAIEATLVALE
jgi:hypothetical protein